jgi:peptidoglycan/xylan/chitin deacetylase (PgdA/CDA1 family)
MQDSHRWEVQLHAGRGHQQIQYGPGPDDIGPFYTHVEQGEDFEDWQQRTRSDIEWGQETLARHVRGYRPRAFSPPFGDYGQDSNNDPRIPGVLLGWLADRFDAVFTQDVNARARPGAGPPLGRIQVTRATTGGDLYAMLLAGK